jgi:hypothetical protein
VGFATSFKNDKGIEMGISFSQWFSKWWRETMAAIFAAPPLVILVWLEDRLAPYVAAQSPVTVLRVIVFMLATIIVLAVYLFIHKPWLTWDAANGTWFNRLSGIRYCGKCRASKVLVPLKNQGVGWVCVSCEKFHTDPVNKMNAETTQRIVARSVSMRN